MPNFNFILEGDKANVKQLKIIQDVFDPTVKAFVYAYGGAIRGGKTYVKLFILHLLCMNYPGSRWVIVRKDLPDLKTTTIPSFLKLIIERFYGRMNFGSPITFNYKNGSQLIFMPENISHDPDLNSFLGVECNGFFLEQAEDLTKKMYDMAIQRAGSWYIDPMPPSYIFITMNPNDGWSHDEIYKPYVSGILPDHIYYLPALPTDNPHVTDEQYRNWNMLPKEVRDRMILGLWDDIGKVSKWIYTFNRSKHVIKDVRIDLDEPIYESYDFNVSPTTCTLMQPIRDTVENGGGVFFFKEFKAEGGTEKLANIVNEWWADNLSEYRGINYITGDVSGSKRDTRSNTTDYEIISKVRGVPMVRFIDTLGNNFRLEYSKDLINTAYYNNLIFIDEDGCPELIKDVIKATPDKNGRGLLKDRDQFKMDLFDSHRYNLHCIFNNIQKILNFARMMYGESKID